MKKEISITEQILLTGATLPPTNEWLIVRVGETSEKSSGFKFAVWKSKLEKWIDETGQNITDLVIMWAKIPARNPKITLSEEAIYSKEDLEKIEKLRRASEKESFLKRSKTSQQSLTYLKDLNVGDKIYNHRIICTIIKKYRKGGKKFVLLKNGFDEFEKVYDDQTTVSPFIKKDLSHVIVRDYIKEMPTKLLLQNYQSRHFSDEYSEQEYLEMKAELNTREHVPNKKERKLIRKNKSSQKNRRTR